MSNQIQMKGKKWSETQSTNEAYIELKLHFYLWNYVQNFPRKITTKTWQKMKIVIIEWYECIHIL